MTFPSLSWWMKLIIGVLIIGILVVVLRVGCSVNHDGRLFEVHQDLVK